jgi:hypothetical protein
MRQSDEKFTNGSLFKNYTGRGDLEIIDEDGKIILKWILKIQDVGVWKDSFSAGYKPVAGFLNAEMKVGSSV